VPGRHAVGATCPRRVLPLSRSEAQAMVREMRAFALLDGLRGRPVADVPALVELLLKVSDFVASRPGQAPRPLDAVIVGRFGARPPSPASLGSR
jgi:acetate---CoA ligase (ADP-forming)